jgi:hypothetical protein
MANCYVGRSVAQKGFGDGYYFLVKTLTVISSAGYDCLAFNGNEYEDQFMYFYTESYENALVLSLKATLILRSSPINSLRWVSDEKTASATVYCEGFYYSQMYFHQVNFSDNYVGNYGSFGVYKYFAKSDFTNCLFDRCNGGTAKEGGLMELDYGTHNFNDCNFINSSNAGKTGTKVVAVIFISSNQATVNFNNVFFNG